MADQIIPLTNSPGQVFTVALAINGGITRLTLNFNYNEMANYWIMKVTDANGIVLLDSVPLVTGVWPAANLLAQYQYLNIGSCYVINASNVPGYDYPNYINLGSDFVLIWGDNYVND